MLSAELTPSSLTVLKAIRCNGPIARSQLPTVTGLSGATITQLTAELILRGLVLEERLPSTRPGRPRINLVVNADNAIVIGVSIADTVMSTGFIDLMGKRLFACDLPWGSPDSLSDMAIRMADNLAQAIADSPFSPRDISQIVIALPALVDSATGMVHFMVSLANEPAPFAQIIADRLAIPVIIENDMVCMARGEHWFGRARDLASFTMIHVGHAVGAARYVNGRPLGGISGLNGQLGHVKTAYGADARNCYCGGKGCVSAYSALFGILRLDPAGLSGGDAPLTDTDTLFVTLLAQADAGDAEARRRLVDAGTHLGKMIATHITSTDPENLVVLFAFRGLADYAQEAMHAAIREHCFPGFLPRTRVIVDVTADEWKWQGLAALALERTYFSRAVA